MGGAVAGRCCCRPYRAPGRWAWAGARRLPSVLADGVGAGGAWAAPLADQHVVIRSVPVVDSPAPVNHDLARVALAARPPTAGGAWMLTGLDWSIAPIGQQAPTTESARTVPAQRGPPGTLRFGVLKLRLDATARRQNTAPSDGLRSQDERSLEQRLDANERRSSAYQTRVPPVPGAQPEVPGHAVYSSPDDDQRSEMMWLAAARASRMVCSS